MFKGVGVFVCSGFLLRFFNQHSIINNILNTLNYYQYYYSVLFCWNKEKQD